MYQIEYDIPLPTDRRGGAPTTYPLATMRVGGSFLVPCDPVTPEDRRRVSAAVAGYTARRKTAGDPVKFVTRTVDGGLRVWRTA